MGSAPVVSDLVRVALCVSDVRHLAWRSDPDHLPPCDRCTSWAARHYVAGALVVPSDH